MEWTNRHNLNRGYMKLSVRGDAIQLFNFTGLDLDQLAKLDFKLKSQILDAVQSVSANIAEGYCRRSLKEYIQSLYIALRCSGEAMTRMIGISVTRQSDPEEFEEFDALHYSVENKLVALAKSLQAEMKDKTWNENLEEAHRSPLD